MSLRLNKKRKPLIYVEMILLRAIAIALTIICPFSTPLSTPLSIYLPAQENTRED